MSIRRRSRRACLPCKRRKRRCDGEFPCNTCVEFEYNCAYEEPSTGLASPTPIRERINTSLQPGTSGELASQTSDIQATEPAFAPDQDEDKFYEPNKHRFYDASSAISFPRALAVSLHTNLPPRIHSFAYNVGLLSEQFLEPPERRLFDMLDIHTAQQLSTKYFQVVNRVFDVVDSNSYFEQLYMLWNNTPNMLHFELLACFVILLGSFFTMPVRFQNHQELSRYAQELLSRSSFATAPSLLHTNHFQAWILQTIYVRSTTRPNVAWLSSSMTLHVAESLGFHRELDSLDQLGIESHENESRDESSRRQLFWLAWMLNRLISFEVGRSPTWLADVNIKKPSADSGSVGMKAVETYFLLYPGGDNQQTQNPQLCLDTLAKSAQVEGTQEPHIALLRADMALGLYRGMHKHSTQSLERSGKRFVAILQPALLAAQKLLQDDEPWWWLTSVPFQCVCTSISIGKSQLLQMLPEAVRLLQATNEVFGTRMTFEAYETAQHLLKAALQSKGTDSAVINNVLSTAVTWNTMADRDFLDFDDPNLSMGDLQ